MVATSHFFSFFFFVITIITIIVFALHLYIGIADKYTTNIIIGSNRASSSSEFFVCAHIYMIDFHSSITNIDIHHMILPFFFWLICLTDISSSKFYQACSSIYCLYSIFKNRLQYARYNRSLMFIFNSNKYISQQ